MSEQLKRGMSVIFDNKRICKLLQYRTEKDGSIIRVEISDGNPFFVNRSRIIPMVKTRLILNYWIVGDEFVYGLKLSESLIESKERAGDVLLPTHAPHTRFAFAKIRQREIITELAKRFKNGYDVNGAFAVKQIEKINKCSKIMNYYCKP